MQTRDCSTNNGSRRSDPKFSVRDFDMEGFLVRRPSRSTRDGKAVKPDPASLNNVGPCYRMVSAALSAWTRGPQKANTGALHFVGIQLCVDGARFEEKRWLFSSKQVGSLPNIPLPMCNSWG